MSANDMETSGILLPRMSQIQALPKFRLIVTWADGSRAGKTDTVDLAPVINTYKFYRPLRKNEELFQTAHLIDDGHAIAWGDDSIDMSAELLDDIAREVMTPQAFTKFLERNKLTQEAAAALLGYSRRQIGYYVSTGPIPRVVALACYGYEARSGANEERQSRNEAMHSIYEQATEEAHAMLSQAAQRFAEVLEELKQMSSDIRRELDATRAELRKGILALPQEAAAATQQMRRIIVDEIEALAELNRIIARHGRGLDIVEPTTRTMGPAEPSARRDVAREGHAPTLRSPGLTRARCPPDD